MKCPNCHNRIVKSEESGTILFSRRMVIRKSDGEIFLVCPGCKAPVQATEEVRATIRKAVLLKRDLQGPPVRV